MDRQITKQEILQAKRKKLFIALAICIGIVALSIIVLPLFRTSIKESNLKFGTVDRGSIETSINATGKVVPAFEEIINSPIASRIIEVYCKAGDSVNAGTPLLRLDLQSAETELKKLTDEHAIKEYGLKQSSLSANTLTSDLRMQIQVKEMSVNQLREDVYNERRLDSIGSGTGERIRQAELAYNTAQLELEQLRQQLANEIKMQASTESMKQLELSISNSNISLMQRTIDDASLKAPRAATLTYIVNEIGRQVNAGERIAVIADLKHFKVEGQIADSYAPRFGVGSQVIVQFGKEHLTGTITNIVPQSQGGVITFTAVLDDDSNPKLRSGLSTQVYVLTDIIEDVVRMPNGPYYTGPGVYKMFVRNGSSIECREVRLGQSNYEFVEVESGIQPGEIAVTSDMKEFANHKQINLK